MTDQSLQPLDEDWRTALAVVAHPDDLEYGTASAVSKWTSEGKTVIYLLATRGEAGIDGMHPDDSAESPHSRKRSTERASLVSTRSSSWTTLTAWLSTGSHFGET